MDYEKLKKCISDRMPAEYLSEHIVEEQYYKHPFFNWELNFDPNKRDGQILPTEYRYYNKKHIYDAHGKLINLHDYNFPKGYNWLPIYLRAMDKHNEKHLLPVAFIAIFTRHYIKSYIEKWRHISDTFDAYKLMRLSEEELRANEYGTPDHRCKEFFETKTSEADQAGVCSLVRNLNEKDTSLAEEALADVIIKCVKYMTDNYHMVYWSYPDSEYDRAMQIYKEANYRYQENLLRAIGYYQEHPDE